MLNKSSTNETSSEHISIPLKCSSVDGINSVLSAIKMEKTTNSLNRIAEQMSAEFNETVSIKLIPEMMEFRNVLEETDSEGSSSLGRNEDETEEIVPAEMGNKNDNENMKEQVDFIIDNKCTLMHADETDIELVREHAGDENNEVYDEKMKEYTTENEEAERSIKTVTDIFKTISLGQTRIRDVTVGEKKRESKLDSEGTSSLGRHGDETEEIVPSEIGYKNENGNQEEQAKFIIDNTFTFALLDKTDMELVQRRTNSERNEVSGVQQSYEIYETENEESAWDINKITDPFPAIRSGLDRTQNVTIVEDKTKSKLADYDITPTRRPDTNQLARMNKDKDKIPKIRSYLRNEVYTTDDDMFKDVLHNMITILTSFINQMTSTRIAIHKLQQLERRYDKEHIFTRRGFQNQSDKLKESIKKRQPSFAYDQEKIERFPRKSIEGDVREKKYDDTIKKPAYYDQTPTRRPDTNQLTRMDKDKDKIPKVLLETRPEGKETKDFGQYELDRAYYDKTPTRCPDTNQLTKMKMDKDKIPKDGTHLLENS
ncbi:uncharacterized protein LOC132715037 [Ruditapes philippinarum]|uniref:uncharacterized protein LOC132715037 n=1 Tax=Ruditapes philippinarum TaxID=129788 RepID=UPI00295AE181|nr:uncharacterized protein LOC132715037 [Ruditapes philippinarum]